MLVPAQGQGGSESPSSSVLAHTQRLLLLFRDFFGIFLALCVKPGETEEELEGVQALQVPRKDVQAHSCCRKALPALRSRGGVAGGDREGTRGAGTGRIPTQGTALGALGFLWGW